MIPAIVCNEDGGWCRYESGLPRVLFDESHSERNTLSWGRALGIEPEHPDWLYFGALRAALGDEFEFDRNPDEPLVLGLLGGYDALIISAPDEELTPAEIEAVRAYMSGGGGLLVLGDAGIDWTLNALTSNWGITFAPTLLWSPTDDGDFAITDFAAHPAVVGVTQITTNWSGSLVVEDPAVPLAHTPSQVWQESGPENWVRDPGEPGGPFPMAAAYERNRARVVAVADNAFQDSAFEWRANDTFVRALLRWLTGERPEIEYRLNLPAVLR